MDGSHNHIEPLEIEGELCVPKLAMFSKVLRQMVPTPKYFSQLWAVYNDVITTVYKFCHVEFLLP